MGGRHYLKKPNLAADQGDANKGRKSRVLRSLGRDGVTAVSERNRASCSIDLFKPEILGLNWASSDLPACSTKETNGGETEAYSDIKTIREETGSYRNNQIPIKKRKIYRMSNNNYHNQTPSEEKKSCGNSQTPREQTENLNTLTGETEIFCNNQTFIEETEVYRNNQTFIEETEVHSNNQTSREDTELYSNNQTSIEETEVYSNSQTSREETGVHNNPMLREEIEAYSNSQISRGETEAYLNNSTPSERAKACSTTLMSREENQCLEDIFAALLAQAVNGTDCCFSLDIPTSRGVFGQFSNNRSRSVTSQLPVVLKKCSVVLVDCLSVDFLRFLPELFGEYSPKRKVSRKCSRTKRPMLEFPSSKRVRLESKSSKTLNRNKFSSLEPDKCNSLSSPNSAKKLAEKDIISGSSNKAEETIGSSYTHGNICRDLSNENNMTSLVSVVSKNCSASSECSTSRPNFDSRVESEAVTTSLMPDENSQKVPKLFQKFLVVGDQKFSYFVTDTLVELEKQQKAQQYLERNVPDASPEIKELLKLRNKNPSRRWSNKVIQCDITDADINKIVKDCYKTFSHKNVTDEEVKVVYKDGVKMYGCNRCSRNFALIWEMYKHRWSHYDLRPFQCPFCERNYRHSAGLRQHLYTHSPRRDHFCTECGLDFRRKNDLANHMITHMPDEKVKCTHPGCNKVFKRRLHMITHSKTHSLEKKFLCNACGLGFKSKSYLLKHLRIHTDERPFKCDQCDASYRLFFGLKMHKMRHLGIRPYICSVCFSTFPYTTSLRGHMRSQHPESSLT